MVISAYRQQLLETVVVVMSNDDPDKLPFGNTVHVATVCLVPG